MGLKELSSYNSRWRGYDYYKNKKVLSIQKVSDTEYNSIVKGSYGDNYNVHIDTEHPRKSSCNCPYAKDTNIICKHMIATLFTAHPEEAEEYYEDVVKVQEEIQKAEERRIDVLRKCINEMSFDELKENFIEVLTSGPDWQLENFLEENDIYEEFFDIYDEYYKDIEE